MTTTHEPELAERLRTLGRAVSDERSVIEIGPRQPGFRNAVVELWRYRRFVFYFGRGFVRKRFARTWLGVTWLGLRPALNVGSKLLVFGGLVGISAGNTPYPVFFLISSAAWQLFAESLYWSSRSLYINRSILKVFHLPRLVVISATAIPSFVDFLIGVAIAGTGLLYYLVKVHTLYLTLRWHSVLDVGGGLALILLLGVGAGIVVAVAGARARDVRFLLGYGLNLLYFMTPVIYPFSSIPNKYKPLAEINPMTGAMELFKSGLFGGETVSANAVMVSVAAVIVIWGPGLWFFHRQEVREW